MELKGHLYELKHQLVVYKKALLTSADLHKLMPA